MRGEEEEIKRCSINSLSHVLKGVSGEIECREVIGQLLLFHMHFFLD